MGSTGLVVSAHADRDTFTKSIDNPCSKVDRTCNALDDGLGDIVNLLNPDRLVLCGWMFDALRPWLMPKLAERMGARAVPLAGGLDGSLAVLSVGPLDVSGPPVTAGMAIFALEDVLARRGLPSRVV